MKREASSQSATTDISQFDSPLRNCPLCLSARISRYDHDFTGKTIDACGECGVKFLNPQYSDEYLADLYSRYIPTEEVAEQAGKADGTWREMIHSHYLSHIEQHVKKGRLLSIGSGDGLEVEVAHSRGWQVTAHDVDTRALMPLADRLGAEVIGGDFVGADIEAESFDCVYLHHVLEHPKNPRDYLARITSLLKPGGGLFIACPNVDGFNARVKTLIGKLHLKSTRGKHYDSWHHLFHYSPKVLKRVLERDFGFKVVWAANGYGEQAREYGERKLKRSFELDRFQPCWKSVFILLAVREGAPETAALLSESE